VRKGEVLRGEVITCKQGHELLAHFMPQNEMSCVKFLNTIN
jgi:hypothetical protein